MPFNSVPRCVLNEIFTLNVWKTQVYFMASTWPKLNDILYQIKTCIQSVLNLESIP